MSGGIPFSFATRNCYASSLRASGSTLNALANNAGTCGEVLRSPFALRILLCCSAISLFDETIQTERSSRDLFAMAEHFHLRPLRMICNDDTLSAPPLFILTLFNGPFCANQRMERKENAPRPRNLKSTDHARHSLRTPGSERGDLPMSEVRASAQTSEKQRTLIRSPL